jgi:GAF domain-containing protein
MARGAVNLLDATHLHAFGAVGFPTCSVPRETTLCAQITGRAPNVYAFADLQQEPGFWGNPAVDGRVANVRAYGSAPIQIRGTVIGTLCVVHDQPVTLTLDQCDRLREMALHAEAVIQQWTDAPSAQHRG